MVLEGGALEVGSPAAPIAANVTADIVIADRPFDPAVDPSQAGNGIVALGKVTMHGAPKMPTFIRFGQEPLAGATTLVLEKAVDGWRPGDTVVIPDTRQLRAGESGRSYQPQSEKVRIASVSGARVTLEAPLAYDHKGPEARPDGLSSSRTPAISVATWWCARRTRWARADTCCSRHGPTWTFATRSSASSAGRRWAFWTTPRWTAKGASDGWGRIRSGGTRSISITPSVRSRHQPTGISSPSSATPSTARRSGGWSFTAATTG